MSGFFKVAFLLFFLTFGLGNPIKKKVGYGPGDQDWGWIDVRKGAHMFYWLYYSSAVEGSRYDRPLVIWLQGGPGASSTGYGNFAEIGPLHVNGTERVYTWTWRVNLLFIDNPVGAGFSYVDSNDLYTKNNVEIGNDMTVFIKEFYEKFPDFRKTPLYIFSESYGGKMAVEIAKQLDESIKAGKMNINFRGVALGDSWISPIDSVLTWAPFLLNTGMIDERSSKRIGEGAEEIKKALADGMYRKATQLWADLEGKIIEETGNIDFYNILYKVKPGFGTNRKIDSLDVTKSEEDLIDILMNGPVRKALQIPKSIVYGRQRNQVFNALYEDFMKPVTDVVEHLLDNTNVEVVVFSGQLDLIVDTYGTLRWVNNLKWKGSSKWENAKREPVVLSGFIEGYYARAENLHFYWINRAGHMVPTDNPETSVEMLRRVTKFESVCNEREKIKPSGKI